MENSDQNITVLVTGGTGLIGSAIKRIIENGNSNKNEKFVFVSSKDGDLR